ncbi:MAG TPA: AIR synthase-related protein, partial [Actinomycetota bacterium]|nr:AIR synthase-related protein [Actinomycetota bacterium]
GDALLEPTAIYADALAAAKRTGRLHAAAHVTGGGLPENLPRVLPEGLGAVLDRSAWEIPAVQEAIARAGGLTEEDARATFNMGIGMVLVTDDPDPVASETGGVVIGRVVAGEGVSW